MTQLKERFKALKLNDTVVEYQPHREKSEVKETIITKIGKKYIYTNSGYYNKYDIVTGSGEYGQHLFPGNIDEYNSFIKSREKARSLWNKINKSIFELTEEELDKLEKFFE